MEIENIVHLARSLQDIKDQMEELVEQAKDVINDVYQFEGGGFTSARAQSYWLPQFEAAIDGNSMVTMENTIDEIMELSRGE